MPTCNLFPIFHFTWFSSTTNVFWFKMFEIRYGLVFWKMELQWRVRNCSNAEFGGVLLCVGKQMLTLRILLKISFHFEGEMTLVLRTEQLCITIRWSDKYLKFLWAIVRGYCRHLWCLSLHRIRIHCSWCSIESRRHTF